MAAAKAGLRHYSREAVGTMGTWMPGKGNSPKTGVKRTNQPARESGKTKGINPSQILKGYCRRSRSYKRADYDAVMAQAGIRKKK